MSIDEEARSDLELTDDDAAGVVGGLKKNAKKTLKPAAHATAAPMIKQMFTPASVSSAPPEDDCDDPGYAGDPSST